MCDSSVCDRSVGAEVVVSVTGVSGEAVVCVTVVCVLRW